MEVHRDKKGKLFFFDVATVKIVYSYLIHSRSQRKWNERARDEGNEEERMCVGGEGEGVVKQTTLRRREGETGHRLR